MSGILRLESLTKGNTLKQGDKTPLKYRLFDADGESLNIAGKSAKVRLAYPDFLTIGYEKDGLIVAQDDTVIFTIDSVIPSRIYHVEIIVDDKFIFPSRADESKFTVDKSSLGADANIIEIVGKDVLIQAVKSQVDTELQPLVTTLESAQQAEAQRATAESSRASAEAQRKTDHENRSAEFDGKADKVVLQNLVTNGNFENGTQGWIKGQNITVSTADNTVTITSKDNGYNFFYNSLQRMFDVNDSDVIYVNLHSEVGDGVKASYSLESGNQTYSHTDMINGVNSNIFKVSTTKRRYFMLTVKGSLQTIKVKNVTILNLTDIFGAGNEPSKAEMDELIKVADYIDGEYVLNNKEMLGYLMKGIHEKADKKQEDWITPTLVNGATAYGNSNVGYYKDEFGIVHLRGRVITTATNTGMFYLPLNYRPTQDMNFPAFDRGLKANFIEVCARGGYVLAYNIPVGYVSLDGISFRTEV